MFQRFQTNFESINKSNALLFLFFRQNCCETVGSDNLGSSQNANLAEVLWMTSISLNTVVMVQDFRRIMNTFLDRTYSVKKVV